MTLVAGIDVGNSTTEVVLAESGVGHPPVPVAWDRAPTRGTKGSPASWEHAMRVLGRVERRHGSLAELVAVTRQHPVDTATVALPEPVVDTGPLLVEGRVARSPGRAGYGVGRPCDLAGPVPGNGPVVAVASSGLGFRAATLRLQEWQAAGAQIVAVVLAGDDAVLVGNRWDARVPIADEVDAEAVLHADLVAVEVAPVGHLVTRLADPVRLGAELGPVDPAAALGAAALVAGRRQAVVLRTSERSQAPPAEPAPWADLASGRTRVDLAEALLAVADRGERVVRWSRGGEPTAVADLFGLDLSRAAAAVWARPRHGGAVVSALTHGSGNPAVAAAEALAPLAARLVEVGSEPAAARAGALSTPGAEPGALVLDIGGGTVDAMPPDSSGSSVAGAGELLTLAVATVLGIPAGAADWVKRGPAARLEGPHLLVDESGERSFLDSPAPADAVGALVVDGPAGMLPFHRGLAAAEWRALRLRLKAAILGANVGRALAGHPAGGLIVVGGPAGDEELLQALGAALPGRVIGRGDVAGRLGHRWAVAYGLTLLATAGSGA